MQTWQSWDLPLQYITARQLSALNGVIRLLGIVLICWTDSRRGVFVCQGTLKLMGLMSSETIEEIFGTGLCNGPQSMAEYLEDWASFTDALFHAIQRPRYKFGNVTLVVNSFRMKLQPIQSRTLARLTLIYLDPCPQWHLWHLELSSVPSTRPL